MTEWTTTPLSEALAFREGPGIMAVDFHEDGVPLIRLAGLKVGASVLDGCNYLDAAKVAKRWAHFQVQEGDVLLSTSASLGEVAVVGPDAVGAVPYTGIISFRPADDRVDAAFIAHMLTAPTFKAQIQAMGVGSVMKHFGPSHLRQMNVSFPAVHEQRAIAEVLGALDDKIAANRKVDTQSRELAATMVSGIASRVPLDAVAGASRRTLSPVSFGSDPVLHFSLPACDNGVPELVVDPSDIKSAKFRLTEPCVLVSKLNPRIPRIWDVPSLPDMVCLSSTEFVVLTPRSGTTSALAAALDDPRFSVALRGKVAGTSGSHQRVKPAELLATEVADIRTLNASEMNSLAALGKLRASLVDENEKLAKTRDGLLPLLMSGKLRVKDAAKQIGEVV